MYLEWCVVAAAAVAAMKKVACNQILLVSCEWNTNFAAEIRLTRPFGEKCRNFSKFPRNVITSRHFLCYNKKNEKRISIALKIIFWECKIFFYRGTKKKTPCVLYSEAYTCKFVKFIKENLILRFYIWKRCFVKGQNVDRVFLKWIFFFLEKVPKEEFKII